MRTAGIFFVHYPDVKVCRGGARETKTIKSRRQRRFLLETLYATRRLSQSLATNRADFMQMTLPAAKAGGRVTLPRAPSASSDF
jgi:hypothetical protein